MSSIFFLFIFLRNVLGEPLLWNIPLEATKFFGRVNYLDNINSKGRKAPVILTGMSGIGKTSLAYYYARFHQDEFDIIWKFDAKKDFQDQIVRFSKHLYRLDSFLEKPNFSDFTECLPFMRDWLRYTKLNWIIIFDDAKSYGDISIYIPDITCNEKKRIIVTSLSTREQEFSMKIEKFSPQEAIDLLRFHLGDKIKEEELLSLAETVDFHPLALRQAVSFIKFTPSTDIQGYISLFQNKNEDFWKKENMALANDNFRKNQPKLYKSIMLSLEQLKRENPESYRLLVFLTQIHHSHFEGKVVKEWIDEFAKKNQTIFGVLLDYALISKVEGEKSTDMFAIHNYVRDVILSFSSSEEIRSARKTGIELFSRFLSGSPDAVLPYFEKNQNHINHLDVLCASNTEIDSDHTLDLSVKLLFYIYYAQRRYDESEALARKINTAIEKKPFENKLLIASFHNMNAYMKYLSVGLDGAIEESLKAYNLLKAIESKEAKRELVILLSNNLGFFYHWQGNIEKCEACVKEVEEIAKTLNDKTMKMLVDGYKLIVYCDKGDFKKAQALVPEIRSAYENDEFLKRVTGHFNQKLEALLALKQDMNREAAVISESAYKLAIEASDGNENADIVGRTCIPLSISKSRLENFTDAEIFARKAIKIFDEVYKSTDKNRRQAKAHFALGLALEGQSKFDAAFGEYMTAEKIYEKNFVQFQVDDISELFFKMFEIGIKLKDDMLIKKYMEKHINIFGHNHPRSIKMFQIIEA